MSSESTVTVNGKQFEVPEGQLYCKKCKSTNFIYDDMNPPYFCADCGSPLDADNKGGYYAQLADLAGEGWACFMDGELHPALEKFDKILEQEDDNATYFQCRAVINQALVKKYKSVDKLSLEFQYKADYDLFRARLIDMKDRAGGMNISTEVEEKLGLEKRTPLIKSEWPYKFNSGETGEAVFRVNITEGEPRLCEMFYSGGRSVLLRRRIDQYILMNRLPEEAAKALSENDSAQIIDVSQNETGAETSGFSYTAKIRRLPQCVNIDKPEAVREDGYPLFASLAALVRELTAEGLLITEILPKDDLPTLAAILAREEDYPMLDKYLAESLPLNEQVNWLFKDWQPTPLFYITTKIAVQSMKDPVKMIRYLTEHGADPCLESAEGDTPLGNLCYASGRPEIMQALIEAGADPNQKSHVEEGNYMSPLFLILCPDEYDQQTHIFKPLTQSQVERAKLLAAAGANVNEKSESGQTPLGMALTYAEGAQRLELFTLLRGKGANLDEALTGMENLLKHGNGEFGFALYLYRTGWMRRTEHLPEPAGTISNEEFERGVSFFEQSAKAGYKPAIEAQKPHEYIPCLD